MPGLPSLSLLSEEVSAELAAHERRADALDSKAGVLLGFSGVIVALTATNLGGGLALAGTWAAGAAALLAGVAFLPRRFPTIALRNLRDKHLMAAEEFTRLRLLDTRILMYQQIQGTLKIKGWLVAIAAGALGVAVVLTVLASTVDAGGNQHEQRNGPGQSGASSDRAAAAL